MTIFGRLILTARSCAFLAGGIALEAVPNPINRNVASTFRMNSYSKNRNVFNTCFRRSRTAAASKLFIMRGSAFAGLEYAILMSSS